MGARINIWMLVGVLAAVLMSAGCASVRSPSQTGYQGAAVGAATGAVAGMLLDGDNRWKGGVIGGALGAVLGGALSEINRQPAPQPAYVYQNTSAPAAPQCHTVVEKIYENGRLVRENQRQVCPEG